MRPVQYHVVAALALLVMVRAQESPLSGIMSMLGNVKNMTGAGGAGGDTPDIGAHIGAVMSQVFGEGSTMKECNETVACAEGMVCQALPFGAMCLDNRMIPCQKDADCDSTTCHLPPGTSSGYCQGCETDDDCTSSNSNLNKCFRMPAGMKYGFCAYCTHDIDCSAGHYCDSGVAGLEEQFGDLLAMVGVDPSGMMKDGPPGRPALAMNTHSLPRLMCRPLLGDGEECLRNDQCASGNCHRKTIFFLLKARKGNCAPPM